MPKALKTYTFAHNEKQYVARMYRDEDMGPPWQEHEGHGIVRRLTRGESKRPGERPMGDGLQYDIPATIELATRDKWGIGDDGKAALAAKLKRDPSPAEVIAEAVRLDFERLRDWVRAEWFWCGVSVVQVDENGEVPDEDYTNAIWGIESDSDYWKECAHEIAGGM